MKKPDGSYSTTRAISLPDERSDSGARLVRGAPTVLDVDGDPRYQDWLLSAADRPLITDLSFETRELVQAELSEPVQARTIGGVRIRNENVFPEVALAFEPPSIGFCSGVLIDKRAIVTAAHCLCQGSIKYAVFGRDFRDIEAHRVRVVGQEWHKEEIKCPNTGASDLEHWRSLAGRDIAVLRLATAVPEKVALPAALSEPTLARQLFDAGNRSLVVVGFGHTEAGDQDIKTLAITGILSADCSGNRAGVTDAAYYGCALGKEILAKDLRLVGPCPGDSGGGAYMLQPSSTQPGKKKAALVGIVSRSVLRTSVKCGDGAIYTLLTAEHLAWIRDKIAALPSDND